MKHQENVKKWFEIHDKPSEQQFYNFFKWIRWIDENISAQDIEGLNNLLIAKADKQAFNTHLEDEILHPSENDRANWNGKLDKTGTAVNSLKLGNQLPSYYVAKQDVYNKQESNNALLLAMNEVVQMLLNNPDVEINSIQELLSEMTTADNALVASIANKVSYVVFQNLSEEQQKIAQKNIGLLNHNHNDIYYTKNYIDTKVISSLEAFNPFTASAKWNRNFGEGITLITNRHGSTGFPEENGATAHFNFGNDTGNTESQLRSFSLWKGTLSNDLYVQFYNLDGTSRGFKKIFTEENLSKKNIDILQINAKALEGKNATDFVLSNGDFDVDTATATFDKDVTSISNYSINLEVTQNLYPYRYGGVTHFNNKSSSQLSSQYRSFSIFKWSGKDRYFLQGYGADGPHGFKEIALLENVQPKQTVAPTSSVTSYTAKASDIGDIVPLDNANTEIILNTASFPRIGDKAQYFYKGTGTCKVATSGSANELKNINDTLEFDGQNSMVEITKTGANEYFVCGQLIRA
ncbi:hypothetical protein LNI98_07195 [Tenacibaculum dicentrarchi]|uniref:hypothetical protein n=1 Tax=Tenacibaculum dicentrarchi TaxID=669041 RepID=UPI001E3FC41B|nr:hypothetical protein [Tenacibaculum dicentrarchi]